MAMLKRIRIQQGFTLVELVITLALAVILFGVGVPAINSMIQGNRLTSSANNMVASLLLARSEAVKRQVQVSVCPSADKSSCSGSGSSPYLIVFTTADGTLNVSDAISSGQSWDANYKSGGAVASINFSSAGLLSDTKIVNLELTDSGKTKCVQVAVSGRPAVYNTCP